MTYEYKVAGQTVRLEPDPSVVAVKFQPGPKSFRAAAADAAGVGPFAQRYEVPGEALTIIPTRVPEEVRQFASVERAVEAVGALNALAEVSHALPVFRLGGNQVVATERVIIGLDDPKVAETVVRNHGLEVLKSEEGRLLASIPEGADPFAVVEAVAAEPGVSYAEPDFVTIGRHIPKRVAPATPPILNDPLLPRQYAMAITQATQAWALQEGDPNIRIAILDEGVDTRHPDLARAFAGGFDTVDGDTMQEPNPWDGHGTACAGLALAVGGDGIGIRGVGAGCSLLAVRIAYAQAAGGPWVTTPDKIRAGVRWAWRNGADVLSNSWGGGAPSNDIAQEFLNARVQGRGGRGCVVVIAAGNSFDAVGFPGLLDGVITVAASNEYDEAKTPSSRDGEDWWGTCHGPEIDVAAPGVHNMTTDISGAAGYQAGDYEPKFNGTSSATPIVAGACGLVLSANPGLTEAEVRAIIADSADKVGQFPYNNGRNDFFGAGRLNVLRAVQLARRA